MGLFSKIGDVVSNVGEALGDIGERALEGVGLKDKDPAQVSIDGGELKHNIDLSDFKPEQRAQIEAVLAEQAEQLGTLQDQLKQAKADGDVPQAKMIEADIAKLDAGLTEMKFELEHTKFNFGKFFVGNLIMPGVGGLIAQGIGSDADKRIQDAFSNLQLSEKSPAEVKAEASGGADGTGATGATEGASGSGGADSAEGSGEASMTDYTTEDYDRMMDKLSRDPGALMQELKDLSPEERNQVMMLLQNRLQEMNRMFSMMSNMQKSLHDTQKAMINNFRV